MDHELDIKNAGDRRDGHCFNRVYGNCPLDTACTFDVVEGRVRQKKGSLLPHSPTIDFEDFAGKEDLFTNHSVELRHQLLIFLTFAEILNNKEHFRIHICLLDFYIDI
jgi:hypothetical protein